MRSISIVLALAPLLAPALATPGAAENPQYGVVDTPSNALGQSVANSSDVFARSTATSDDGIFGVGLMMARGWPDAGTKRDGSVEPRGAVERWEDFPLERDLDGTWKLPGSYEEAKRMLKQGVSESKRGLLKSLVRLTWYSGEDLKNPACGDWRLGGKWSPNNDNMICALTASWSDKNGNKPKCNDFIKLTTRKKQSIIVRVIDACASSEMSRENSCTQGLKVADLTMSAFKKLATLTQGIIDDVEVEIISKPGGKTWTKADIKLYGPEHY